MYKGFIYLYFIVKCSVMISLKDKYTILYTIACREKRM